MGAHAYTTADGTPIPSVSTVLAQLKSSYRSKQIEEGAELGSMAHALVERAWRGDPPGPDEVPEALASVWEAWQAWHFARSPVLEITPDGRPASELSLVTPASVPASLAYGGTLDYVVRIGSRRVVVDVKTRTVGDRGLQTPDRHCLTQCGAYGWVWEANFPALPLSGALLLMVGRDRPEYREAWLTRAQLEARMREFMCLRTALAEHEAGKVELKASRKAERAGRAA